VTPAVLRAALENSVSLLANLDVTADPDGRFLQVSGLRFDYLFNFEKKPEITLIEVEGDAEGEWVELSAVAPGTTFSVATNSYLAAGGDGFTMLGALPRRPLSLRGYQAVAAHLSSLESATSQDESVALQAAPRIVQRPSNMRVELGVLCKLGSSLDRENCDHVFHAVDLINNKTDGFFDDVLPNARIVAAGAWYDCGKGGGAAAVETLRKTVPNMTAVVGPACSDDVRDLAAAAARAAGGPGSIGDAVMISASSTAPYLADDDDFPLLARMVPNDTPVKILQRTFLD